MFFTVGFSAARDRSPSHETESFTVGFVDFFSFVGFFSSPIYFSLLVLDFGYGPAWLVGSVIAIMLATPLLFLRTRDRHQKITDEPGIPRLDD
jgi:MFS family permease